MMGAASDNKLFASRLALEILTVVNIPVTGDPQGPTVTIADNIGVVNVQQTPVKLLIPFGPNLTIGQQITFNFQLPGPVLIGTVADVNNPPPPPPAVTKAMLSDSNIPGSWTSIVYDLLNIKPAPSVYAGSGAVEGITSVTFSLTAIGGTPGNTTYFWTGVSTPAKNTLLTPGSYTVAEPAQATKLYVTTWAGGGAGGKNAGAGSSSIGDCCGAGGGAGAAFSLTQFRS